MFFWLVLLQCYHFHQINEFDTYFDFLWIKKCLNEKYLYNILYICMIWKMLLIWYSIFSILDLWEISLPFLYLFSNCLCWFRLAAFCLTVLFCSLFTVTLLFTFLWKSRQKFLCGRFWLFILVSSHFVTLIVGWY